MNNYHPTPPLDPNEYSDGPSEFDWGPGLVPRGFEDAPVSEGGRYRGREASEDHPPQHMVQISRDQRI